MSSREVFSDAVFKPSVQFTQGHSEPARSGVVELGVKLFGAATLAAATFVLATAPSEATEPRVSAAALHRLATPPQLTPRLISGAEWVERATVVVPEQQDYGPDPDHGL